MPFETPIFLVRAFRQGEPPLYFVACYAQYRMHSAILRNHLKLIDRKVAKEKLTDGQSNLLSFVFCPGWRNSWRNFSLIA